MSLVSVDASTLICHLGLSSKKVGGPKISVDSSPTYGFVRYIIPNFKITQKNTRCPKILGHVLKGTAYFAHFSYTIHKDLMAIWQFSPTPKDLLCFGSWTPDRVRLLFMDQGDVLDAQSCLVGPGQNNP